MGEANGAGLELVALPRSSPVLLTDSADFAQSASA